MPLMSRSQLGLRLFPAVVFIDWFGTLSTTKFWDSIVHNDRHPLAERMRSSLNQLFVEDKELVREWMRGNVDDKEILLHLHVTLPKRYRSDYLERKLLQDCRRSTVNSEMALLVAQLRQQAYVVVASDNMNCFWEAQPAVLSGSVTVDELVVSSQVGALKAEDPRRFFSPSLEKFGLSKTNAILIDDCPTTCRIFEDWGGTAFYFRTIGELVSEFNNRQPNGLQLTTAV
jgi:FMN phosphatase YigB (HAD superfamily)